MGITHVVLKKADVEMAGVRGRLQTVSELVGMYRKSMGKNPAPEYIVVNRDEPFADEVIEVLKKHGKWDE